jgi:hypothetical protein
MRFASVVLGSLATAAVAAAQAPVRDTTPIPRDLALALIGSTFGRSEPALVIGRLPNPAMAALIPPGARVLGGISHGGRRRSGENNTTILEVRETPDSIINVLESTFERLGWRRPTMIADPAERGGFVTRTIIGGGPFGGTSVGFCSDSSFVTATATPAGHVTIVRLMAMDEGFMCDERRSAMHRFVQIELPRLVPPPGASSIGGGGSSGSDNTRETSVELSSRFTAAEMVAHFAPQLETQGWTLGATVNQPDIAVVTAKKRAENGDTLNLVLLDSRFDVRSHHTSVRVWGPSNYR